MNKLIGFGVAGLAIAAVLMAAGYQAGVSPSANAAAPGAQVGDRAEIESIVRDYLITNPEVMVEVQAALEQKQEEQQRLAASSTIESSREQIYNLASDGIAGNPTGEITLVEFYDYNCGYCKRAQPDVVALIEANPDLRVVLKEFPILGPDSQRAHQISVAFQKLKPDAWNEFHDTMMTAPGRASEQTAMDLAVKLGANEAELRAAMENPEIIAQLRTTFELAEKLNITGTPSFVVGDELVFGAVGKAALQEKITSARDAQASN